MALFCSYKKLLTSSVAITGTLWNGVRSRGENASELRKHSGNACKTEDYFLSRLVRQPPRLEFIDLSLCICLVTK